MKSNQKKDLDAAIRALIDEPKLGDQKKGDLSFLHIYKFKMNKQLTLLGSSFDESKLILKLMVLGSHKNFYRDIKRGI
ncbi:type II toxin-antitoxin system RelE/ParE family toxin [Alteromonas sp. a30]|uniref:type II toxin-antitoxin system RelE/ParE family toxin n=1 Tax=Alteromonas sp. a30 TaxID=2730917 RepID=UPI003FA3B049|nr:type II toxin-antitoxin system RelE/ParE family toxin [Alteromonas sp. a30]